MPRVFIMFDTGFSATIRLQDPDCLFFLCVFLLLKLFLLCLCLILEVRTSVLKYILSSCKNTFFLIHNTAMLHLDLLSFCQSLPESWDSTFALTCSNFHLIFQTLNKETLYFQCLPMNTAPFLTVLYFHTM